jgi:hypothetical protein
MAVICTASQKADHRSVLVAGQERHGDVRGRVTQGQADKSINRLRSDMEGAATPIYVSSPPNFSEFQRWRFHANSASLPTMGIAIPQV